MTTNKSMTCFHKSIANHEETWTKVFIENVMWQEEIIVNPETGFHDISEVSVYIPILIDNISKEDVIVEGETQAITPSGINSKYYTITSVTQCNYGSEEMQHTEIIGK